MSPSNCGENGPESATDGALPSLALVRKLAQRPATSHEERVEQWVEVFRAIGSPAYFDADQLRVWARESLARDAHVGGKQRQLEAIIAAPGRRAALRGLRVPTLVLHGLLDPLQPAVNGLDTARTIPGADLLMLGELAHDLPPQLWERMVEAIARNAALAQREKRGSPNAADR